VAARDGLDRGGEATDEQGPCLLVAAAAASTIATVSPLRETGAA
jgi:hypothetical protein